MSEDERSRENDPRLLEELRDHERLIYASGADHERSRRRWMPIAYLGAAALIVFAVLLLRDLIELAKSNHAPAELVWIAMDVAAILIAVFMLRAPSAAARRASRSLYVLTDRRCVVWTPRAGQGEDVWSFTPNRLQQMHRRDRGPDYGDIVLSVNASCVIPKAEWVEVAFRGIRDPKRVEQLIRATLGVER